MIPKEFNDELSSIQAECTDKIIRLADKYGLDRNLIIETAAHSIYVVAKMGDFSDYEVEEGD